MTLWRNMKERLKEGVPIHFVALHSGKEKKKKEPTIRARSQKWYDKRKAKRKLTKASKRKNRKKK